MKEAAMADEGTEGAPATGADQDGTDTAGAGADAGDAGAQGGSDGGLAEAGRRALAEERRARKAAEAELAKVRKASMTEQERAVADAKASGAAEASKASAPALVRAELRAAAAEAGVPRDALVGFLEYADLSRFVSDSGEVDDKAISAAVKRLGGGNGRANFDGGARGKSATPNDMNSLIRAHAGVS